MPTFPSSVQQVDWIAASMICQKHPNKKCLEATAELMNHFRERAKIIYICTLHKSLRPFITHVSLPGDIISETGQHWAVMLHERVFDNLHHCGETLEQWMLNFEYASKDWKGAHFKKDDIEWWTYKELVDYLRKSGRTRLGNYKRT